MKFNVLLLSLLFSISAFSQNDYLTFYIENNTKTDLYGIYVTGTDSDSWGEDILPDDIFEAGTTLTVTIPINKSTICEQDIQITFSENDENPLVFENIDFCTLDKMILTQKGKTIYYTLEVLEELTFEIENNTKTNMYGVFVNGLFNPLVFSHQHGVVHQLVAHSPIHHGAAPQLQSAGRDIDLQSVLRLIF